jgi:hypothetical protein
MNNKNIISVFIILFLINPIFTSAISSQNEIPKWNEDWSYYQEITIPIETKNDHAKYQPIDIPVTFENQCWAKNTEDHSIRIVCYNQNKWHELESQIYELEYKDENFISSCYIIFLIPEFVSGEEKYFIYYDTKQKNSVDYTDHVEIKNKHYFYEPIPGQGVNLDYYEIIDDKELIYGVGINGKMMTEYGSNLIFRQIKGSTKFDIKNWDQLAGFCFQYDNAQGEVITTRHKTVSNEIIVDGNLMVEFGIESVNEDETIKTTNIYKYYHSPIDSKRICVNSKSQITKNIKIDDNIERDGTYVFLTAFKTISETNDALNIGEILPYYHVYSEDNIIKEFNVNTNPSARDEYKILSIKDDVDLGKNAWFSTDEGTTGKALAIIFSQNNEIIKTGTDERDGIQVKAYEHEEASLPGLKAYSAGIYCGRNSYENQDTWDSLIPSDFTFSFNAELFTTDTKGYEIVNQEAIFFKELIKHRSTTEKHVQDETEEIPTYNLKVIVPFSLSLPLISPISPIPLPITWVELIKNKSVISAGATSRTLQGLKVEFPDIKAGDYLIKVYKKIGTKNKFIAYKTIEVEDNKKIIILPKKQVSLTINVFDQDNNEIKNVKAELTNNNHVIAENTTDDNGEIVLRIPRSDSYQLKLYYKNIQVYSEDIKLRISKKTEYNIELNDLTVKILDRLGLIPDVPLNPIITALNQEIKIRHDYENNKEFTFSNLPKATYNIQVAYENIINEITHDFPNNGKIVNIEFSAEFPLKILVYDSRGNILSDKTAVLDRENKIFYDETSEDGELFFNIPPGKYNLKIYDENTIIREKNLLVLREKNLYLSTDEEPTYPIIVLISAFIFLIIGFILLSINKIKIPSLLKIFVISLIIISLVQPWWILNGESKDNTINRTDINYLIPQIIVTKTTFEDDIISEPSNIPPEFSDFLFILVIMIIICVVLTTISIILSNYRKISLITSIISVILLIQVVGIYFYAFSELTNVGLGGIQGSGSLSILNPSINGNVDINADWGVSYGVILCIMSIIIYVSTFFLRNFFKIFNVKKFNTE